MMNKKIDASASTLAEFAPYYLAIQNVTIESVGGESVVFSGYDTIMGNTIIISHSDNIFSLYAHNDTNLVNIREFVDINTSIAKIGDSGVSGGPHLHFEIWQGNKILDPRDLINNYKVNDVSIE